MRTVAACLASFAVSLAFAQAPQAPPPVQAPATAPQAQPPKVAATIADAAWLQGYWVGEGMGGVGEDNWMPPSKGVMLGTFRLSKSDGSKEFYELLGIEEFEGSLRLVVKHFNTDWVGWEEKDFSYKFRLTKLASDELVFGALAFQRTAPDTFIFRITMRQKEGPPKVETITFRKKAL
jgi:hypothetical protein